MDVNNASENEKSKFTMSDDDSEFEEIDGGKHAKFLESIGVDLKEDEAEKDAGPRTEPSKDVSLFTLSQIGESENQKKIYLHQLMMDMKDSSKANVLRKRVNKLQKSTLLLNAPLSKPVAERLERKVEYEKSSTVVGKWDPIVQKHRKAEHMSFPLKQEHLRIKTVDQSFNVQGSKMTPLEEEISLLLSGNKCNERPDHELSVMEEEALAAMSLEEAQARLVELRKHRALLSYQQAKNKRQHKIKSKSYHRMLRKKKLKEESKIEADEGDYNRADRLRAEERASLRHRMGSKWAKSRSLMAKHDENTKFELQEQQRKHEELVEKRIESDDDEKYLSGEGEERKMPECLPNDGLTSELIKGNPWLSQSQQDDTKTIDTVSNHKKANEKSTDVASNNESLRSWLNDQSYSLEKNETTVIPVIATEAIQKFKSAFSQVKSIKATKESSHAVRDNLKNSSKNEDEDGLHEVDTPVNSDEQTNHNDHSSKVSFTDNQSLSEISHVKVKASSLFNDTSETVSQVQPKLIENHDSEEHEMTIEQAFADDDVLAEFQTEKDEVVENFNKIEEVDLKLPGWGKWGGSGVVVRKKKTTFPRKPLPLPTPRRDQDLGHVILSENRDVHIAKHQVNQVPFPFVNKAQFERSVARPIGSTWNTPETVSTLIKPKVSTVMGAIISPIDEDDVVGTIKPKLKRKASKTAQRKRGLKIVQSRIQDRKSKLDKLLLSVS